MCPFLGRLGTFATIATLVGGALSVTACGNRAHRSEGAPEPRVPSATAASPERSAPTTATSGHSPAAAPHNRIVSGVELIAAPRAVRIQCLKTAQALGFAVPCPNILPMGSYPTGRTCGIFTKFYISPGCRLYSRRLESSIEFPSDTRVGHLVVEAATGKRGVREMINGPVTLPDPVGLVRRVQFRGYRGSLTRVPQESSSISGGHTVLVWYVPDFNETVDVSVHGIDRGAYALVRAVASSLRMTRPR